MHIIRVAAIVAAVAVPSLRAEQWSAWEQRPGTPFSARFEPFLDTRSRSFSNKDLRNYADFFSRLEFPGEVVFERVAQNAAPGGGGIRPGAPLDFTVEVFDVGEENAGAPTIDKAANFAENPRLPFSLPSGRVQRQYATSTVRGAAPAPGADAVRVLVRLPMFWSFTPRHKGVTRLRWRVTEAVGGAEIARGVLPVAFALHDWAGREPTTVDATASGDSSLHGHFGFATRSTPSAWPMLLFDAGSIVLDGAGCDEFFGGDGADAAKFAVRARLGALVPIARDRVASAKLPAAGLRPGVELLAPAVANGRPQLSSGIHIQNSTINKNLPFCGEKEERKRQAERDSNDRKLKPARIPGRHSGARRSRSSRPQLRF